MFTSIQNIDYIEVLPLITLVLIVLGIIAAIFIKPLEFKNTRTSVFISMMGSLAVIILAFNVYISTVNLEAQRVNHSASFTQATIDRLWLLPNRLISERKHARPEFLASLNYNNLTLYNLTKNVHTQPSVESELDERYISIVLIQSWEDYLTFRTLEQTGDVAWLSTFLQWAQSPYLKNVFDYSSHNNASTTVELGNLLFEYAARIPIPTKDRTLYNTLAKTLLQDERLLKIFKERLEKR